MYVHPADPAPWHVLDAILRTWQVPDNYAAVLARALATHQGQLPASAPGHAGVAAQAAAIVQLLDPARIRDGTLTRRARFAHWRREIFQAAYRDPLVAFGALTLHVNDLAAGLDRLGNAERHHLLECTYHVFLPLTEMFGMWHIRTEIAEICLSHFHPDAANAIQRAYARAAQHDHERAAAAAEAVRRRLESAGIQGTIRNHRSSIYSLYRRMLAGASLPRLAAHLKFDLIVETEQDYRRAGQVFLPLNGLLSSDDSRYGAWQLQEKRSFNGYRATVLAAPRSLRESHHLPNQIAIMTRVMEQINLHGFVATTFQALTPPDTTRLWWQNLAPAAAESAESANRLPVFGPSGEQHSVPVGTTAIGFAYRVHEHIGNHCKRIWINGAPAHEHARLHCDDLIEIEFDNYYHGPIEQWFRQTAAPLRPQMMHRAYHQRAPSAHEGRDLLMQELRRQFAVRQMPRPQEERLQQILAAIAREPERNYVHVEALYTDLANHPLQQIGAAPSVQEIAGEVVQALLVGEIRFAGEPQRRLPHQLRVKLVGCRHKKQSYQVIYGQPIVGRYREDRARGRILQIYPHDCPGAPGAEDAVALTWNNEAYVRVVIDATDRSRLLGQMLDYFYRYPDICYVSGLNAEAYNGLHATITADLRIERGHTGTITALLDAMRNEGLIHDYTIRAVAAPTSDRRQAYNPYGIAPAATPGLFKGRTQELARIIRWLQSGTGVIAVAGRKRIGKTSLLRYLVEHELPRREMIAVYSSTGIADPTARGFWTALVVAIDSMVRTSAQQAVHETDPAGWQYPLGMFQKSIARARRRLGRSRMVIVIDEFTRLQERWSAPERADILAHLTMLVEQDADLTLIIGVHTEVIDGHERALQGFLANGPLIRLDHLDDPAARKLIIEPVGDLVRYADDAITRLIELSGGHPYYLQYLLTQLLSDLAPAEPQRINRAEVERTVAAILPDGAVIFEQYREHLQNDAALTVLAVGELAARATQATDATLERILHEHGMILPRTTIRTALKFLVQHGVLRLDRQQQTYSFRIPLLQSWLAHNRSLRESIADYQTDGLCRL
ncbi:MAG: hypothetical protein HC822_12270 [Oscillochloris sp.]|nr:hypothetical protein [Oscillochloris sp.]